MKVKQIRGNTFYIDTGMTYIPFYKINDEEIIMLDSGWAIGERKAIDELLYKNNFKVVGIICSHSHIDHIGNNTYFKEKYNATIAMSFCEALICSSVVNLKVYYNNHTLSEVEKHFGHMVCETDIMIQSNQDEIHMHGTKFKIIHTPGHSPGHICISTPDDVVYLGDALISHEIMEGAKMPYAYILKEDLKTKKKLYDLKFSKYVVAHKGVYDDITELITDNINFYKNRAQRIYELIDRTMTMEEIVKNVINNFNINISTVYKYITIEKMLRSYVEYLKEIGKIETKVENGILKYRRISLNA